MATFPKSNIGLSWLGTVNHATSRIYSGKRKPFADVVLLQNTVAFWQPCLQNTNHQAFKQPASGGCDDKTHQLPVDELF